MIDLCYIYDIVRHDNIFIFKHGQSITILVFTYDASLVERIWLQATTHDPLGHSKFQMCI